MQVLKIAGCSMVYHEAYNVKIYPLGDLQRYSITEITRFSPLVFRFLDVRCCEPIAELRCICLKQNQYWDLWIKYGISGTRQNIGFKMMVKNIRLWLHLSNEYINLQNCINKGFLKSGTRQK